jgi:hypothetical protein
MRYFNQMPEVQTEPSIFEFGEGWRGYSAYWQAVSVR